MLGFQSISQDPLRRAFQDGGLLEPTRATQTADTVSTRLLETAEPTSCSVGRHKMKERDDPSAKKRRMAAKPKLEVLLADLRPLTYYVGDRSSLLDQLFLAVDADDLQALLLPNLQGRSITDLKQDCLTQLKKLSERQILDILQEGVSQPGEQQPGEHQDANSTPTPTADQSTDSCVPTPDPEVLATETPEVARKSPPDGGGALHLCPEETEMESLDPAVLGSEMALDASNTVDQGIKTEREIMELEFRARAIRSLMRAQGLVVADEEDEEVGDIQRSIDETTGQEAPSVAKAE